jgi:hypothetical protein
MFRASGRTLISARKVAIASSPRPVFGRARPLLQQFRQRAALDQLHGEYGRWSSRVPIPEVQSASAD